MNGERELTRWGKALIGFTAIGMAILLSLIITAFVVGGPNHEEILEQQIRVEQQLTYISCLLLIPPEERIPEAVATCQVPTD